MPLFQITLNLDLTRDVHRQRERRLAHIAAQVALLLLIQHIFLLLNAPSAQADYNQFNKSLTGSMMGAESFDMSANGQYQIGVVNGKDVYISSNYGASFSFTGISSDYLSEVAISSDGSKMVIAMQYLPINSLPTPGDLYISTDYGSTWTMSNATQRAWEKILISDDGTKLVGISVDNGVYNLYLSSNSAATWTKYTGVANPYWRDVQMTPSGSVIWAVNSTAASNLQGMYLSTNFGGTFTRKSTIDYTQFSCSLAINSTGSVIYGASSTGLYRSVDTGTTWSKLTSSPPPNPDVFSRTNYSHYCVSISSDAKKVLISGFNEFTYFSTDSATTWTKTTVQEDFNSAPFEPEHAGNRLSEDGTMAMVAFGNNYYTYTFQTPTAPQNLTVSYVSNTSFQLAWQAPSSSGDAPISNYQVETSTNGSTWKIISRADTTTASITLSSLTQGTGYYFRITAANTWGVGAALTSRAYIPGPVPRAPTSLTGTPSNGSVLLSWSSLTETSTIRNYAIEYSDNSGVSYMNFDHPESTATSINVTGLTNGSGYLFRVRAFNDAGFGPWVVSSSVTPRTVPSAPSSVNITSTISTYSLSWTAPSNGGSAITDYEIEYSSTSGASWSTYADGTSTLTSATITGLTSNTNYIFRVTARNISGAGSASIATTALKLLSAGPATITLSLPGNATQASKSTQITITVQVSDDGKIKISANNKVLPGCAALRSASLSTSCKWKPAIKGQVKLVATLVPNDQSLSAVNSLPLYVSVLQRTNRR